MRQRGPTARRSLTLLVTALLAAPTLVGCSKNTGLVRREVVVRFQTGATPADADRVRATCGNVGPHVKALPPSRGNSAIDRRYPVRFDTTGANDAERAQLYACLHKDPSVYGVSEGEA